MMKRALPFAAILVLLSAATIACRRGNRATQVPASTPAVSSTPVAEVPITLPVLDALFADKQFRTDLKSKLQLTDEQIEALKKLSSAEVAKLRQSNAENKAASAEAARQNAIEAIRGVVGSEKLEQLLALARERWNKGSEELEALAAKEAEPTMLKGPNAVPGDTRIVVNIPAFRMDLFENGHLIKSYKVGIGYPQFPLPIGLRKAQIMIFNPTWTPPDEPWVASMSGVAVGEVVAAGSRLNPLGPIKIPIGAPSLIHGGKPLYKIGTFASHGCVGMTNTQVKDFARLLATASGTELSDQTMAGYLRNKTRTQVVKLNKLVPVELRYETIVIEDGKLHIYRDVYDQNTNSEQNMRAVLDANGIAFDSLSAEEKERALEALNALARHPKKQPTPKPTIEANLNAADKLARANERKAEAARQKKLRSQKEIVIELPALSSKGYPAPVNLDSGAGTNLLPPATDTKR
jgi:lipoprotein-anchoring transpeptidase ErfK/SrfK